MAAVSVVYHTTHGHTRRLAESLADGARLVSGTTVHLLEIVPSDIHEGRWKNDAIMSTLGDSDAIVFGCPTYMGSASATFKAFLEKGIEPFLNQAWKNKIAGGFTNSASQSGDKLSTLVQIAICAFQLQMVWVGVGDPPANNWSRGSREDLNRLGSWIGVMGQSNADESPDTAPTEGDRLTARRYGKRIAEATQQWVGETRYPIQRIEEGEFRMNQARYKEEVRQ
ncbi:MAG: flavodoxin family protein [Candidatus Acidiferrales bacterium]